MNMYIKKSIMIAVLFSVLTVFSFLQNISADPAQTNLEKITADMDKYLQQVYPADKPGAAVVVRYQGNEIFRKAYGLANLELNVPMKLDMVFSIGSMTKEFTAIAIFQLLEHGQLSLEDHIDRYIDGLSEELKEIKIENLLTHSSGIKDYFSIPAWMKSITLEVSPKQLFDFVKNEPLLFKPGENADYSNSNYVALGLIIEKVTGIGYNEYISENIIKRAGMSSTYFIDNLKLVKNRASGYSFSEGQFYHPYFVHSSHFYAAGSILTTVDDLTKLASAITNRKMFDSKFLAKFFSHYSLKNGQTSVYGYGWMDNLRKNYFEFSGAVFGYESHSLVLPEEKTFIVVLSNVDTAGSYNPFWPRPVVRQLYKIIKQDKDIVLNSIELTNDQLNKYPGVYKIAERDFQTVTLEEGKLFVDRSGSTKVRLYPLSRSEFIYPENETVKFEFKFDKNGTAQEFTSISIDGKMIKAERTEEPVTQKIDRIFLEASDYEKITGAYDAPFGRLTVKRDGDDLLMKTEGFEPLRMIPVGKYVFIEGDGKVRIEFEEKNNIIEKMILKMDQTVFEAKKIE